MAANDRQGECWHIKPQNSRWGAFADTWHSCLDEQEQWDGSIFHKTQKWIRKPILRQEGLIREISNNGRWNVLAGRFDRWSVGRILGGRWIPLIYWPFLRLGEVWISACDWPSSYQTHQERWLSNPGTGADAIAVAVERILIALQHEVNRCCIYYDNGRCVTERVQLSHTLDCPKEMIIMSSKNSIFNTQCNTNISGHSGNWPRFQRYLFTM